MPRAQGFARGDLDTSFPIDDKFTALRALPPARYYAASGVYFHVAAATWREAERKPASKVCPDAPTEVADLQAVGLLDGNGYITQRAFTKSVGRAKRNRRTAAERVARHRAGKSPVTNGYVRGRNAKYIGSVERDDSLSSSPTGEYDAREFDVELWGRVMRLSEELTGVPHGLRSPYTGIGGQALSQAGSVSWQAFEAAWRKVAAVYGRPTVRQLVLDSEDQLRPLGKAKPVAQTKEQRERAEARAALGLDR